MVTVDLHFALGYRRCYESKVWTVVDAGTVWQRREHTVSLLQRFDTIEEAVCGGNHFLRNELGEK
jgi:hypothetical protein